MAEKVRMTEADLDALREEAKRSRSVPGADVVPLRSPLPQAATSYHGNPVLKEPTWTWQVPLYFFVGGLSGAAAVIAVTAHATGQLELSRVALWVALAGAVVSPPLLIADLGIRTRFLNMLRVLKLRSPMSIGAWTLVGFSGAVALAVVCRELMVAGHANRFVDLIGWAAETLAALIGLILASYTSVLLAVTAIPVWSENRNLLPAIFIAGGFGSAAASLELAGFPVPAMQTIGIAASVVEILAALIIELRRRYVDRPLREGNAGFAIRAGSALAGPISLLLRIFWPHTTGARYLAAASFIIGALISRYAWMAAGRVSSRDPQALFVTQSD
ncbi:MAG: polysulfide reductase NrfD [Acidobacteriales bacterium]|nr:polysulfide reductase NrfD [Terriglobales bacterium]